MATKYVRNADGGVHSIDEEMLNERILEDAAGNTGSRARGPLYLPHGWKYLTEDEARAAHPQLFGAADPNIHKNVEELQRELEHQRLMKELYGTDE